MISILYVITTGIFFFSPVLVAKIMKGDWQKVLDYVLLYGWLGTGWISAWCMIIEIKLEK